jgi:hypothetical protein
MNHDNIYYIMDSVSKDFGRYVDDMMYVGLSQMRIILPIVLIPFIVISLWLIRFGEASSTVFLRQGGKIALATTLIGGSGYIAYVHDFWLNDVTSMFATAINGSGGDITVTQLFYNTAVAITNLQAGALALSTGPLAIVDRGIIEIAGGLAKAILGIGYIVYQGVRIVSFVAVGIGAWMLAFLLFEATRGWTFNILGAIVSLTCWELGIAIVVKVMINRMGAQIRITDAMSGNMDIAGRIDQLFNVIITALCSVLLMIIVGRITAVGGGHAASAIGSSITSGMPGSIAGLGREISRLASNVGKLGKK